MKALKIQSIYAFISRLSKRERNILYATVTIVSLVIFERLIVHPIFFKMALLDKAVKDSEANVKKNMRIMAQKESILSEGARYASFASSEESEEEGMTSTLKEVENIAGKSSVYLIDMKPVGVKNIGPTKKFTVNLNCEGLMEQISGFMFNIENSDKILTIEKYQINPKSKESSVAKCAITVSKIIIP